MKTKIFAGAMLLATLSATPMFASSDRSDLDDRLLQARKVIDQIASTPDKGIPDGIVSHAVCVGVIPSVKKGAFLVGAEYGQGVVSCRTGHGWSAPVFIRLAGGSFGFQIGGQATDLILVAVNDKGFQDLLKSKFKIGADASAAAGPVGRNAQAGTDIQLNAELLTYSRAKGLFAGIDLNGISISQNQDDTDLYYGTKGENFETILHGKQPVPASAKGFVGTLARYFHIARSR
ncbi:lipid-binding SYLF domain-containing protein [Granulicella tundricola]|uniref:Ysc84 actin-binding domain-containing protein n=1 Tax=Granulicella tundricola (strain ATCC BAA-1859 / DSM 23138 / MP5ACTX9) TaxID=1198114 RepID=E8WWT2_GRATM|nr:lipid-binding SYLF domain-containing protein [Granulicella tundricola]ADW67410.1 hypothetical protein AciX9_0338 [Granulicella tundricola MP5ACTX9]